MLLWQFAGDDFLKDADTGGVLAFRDLWRRHQTLEPGERFHGYVEPTQLWNTHTHAPAQPQMILIYYL